MCTGMLYVLGFPAGVVERSMVWESIYRDCRLSRKPLGVRTYSEVAFLLSVNVGFDDLQVCADPGVPENGFRTPSEGVFFESSVTRFHCQDGFKLKGSTKRLCMKHLNGTLGWIPSDKPICVQEGKVLKPTPSPSRGRRSRGLLALPWPRVQGCVCQRGQYPGPPSLSGLVLHADRAACVCSEGRGGR